MSTIAEKSVENFLCRIVGKRFPSPAPSSLRACWGHPEKARSATPEPCSPCCRWPTPQSAAIAWQYAKRNRAPAQLLRAMVVKEQLVYGGQVSMNSAVQFLNFRIDVFIIMFMLGQTPLGIYSIGIGIGEMLWQLSRPATCMRHSFALVLIGAIVVFFVAPPLIPLIYGKQFAHAG